MNRVLFLIDGFNFYHSLINQRKYSKYKWLDYSALAKCFITSEDNIVRILFFTAYTYWNKDKVKRHKKLVQALKSKGIEIVEGRFKRKDKIIKVSDQLSFIHKTHEEKRTDVNIAIRLFQAAMHDDYDTAMILTADSDLVPAIQTIKKDFPTKKVKVIFPIDSYSKDLHDLCGSHSTIKEVHLRTCQLPDSVVVDSIRGITVERPALWR